MPTLTLFPLPGTFQDKPLTISTSKPNGQAWAEITEWAAWQFDCREDEVDLLEAYFGGEYADDDMREALTVNGEVVGVFDKPLTGAEWQEMFSALSQPALASQARSASRAA